MIHCKIGGIDVETEIDADFEALHFIPFRASALNVTNLSIEFFIESVAGSDDVHFKLVENTSVTISGLQIKMNNKVLDELVYLSRGLINRVVKGMLPQIGKAVDEEIANINKMIANEGQYTFVLPVFGQNLPLNLTMTHAPTTKNNLIELFFNGIFDMPKNSSKKFNFDNDISAYPPRL